VREVLDPFLRQARKKKRPPSLLLYEIPAQKTSGGEIGVQMDGSGGAYRADTPYEDEKRFVGD
jgi:hypothetical protein